MTLQPLTFAFPLACDLTSRPLHSIPVDEQLLELEREDEYRQRVYPKRVREGGISEEEAEKHMTIWHQILLDMAPAPVTLGQAALDRHWAEWQERRRASPVRWHHKVRELRREIALRRNVYRKQLGRGADRAELTLQMERIEAVHFTYWVKLDYLDPPMDLDDRGAWLDGVRRRGRATDYGIVTELTRGNPEIAAYPYAQQLAAALYGPFLPPLYGPFRPTPRLDKAA